MKLRLKAFGPKDLLRWVIVAGFAAMALGVTFTFVVVGLGKLGVELMPTFEMKLFIATTAWSSLIPWAATAGGLGAAAVLLARKSKAALGAWLVGFAGAVVSQALEMAAANAAGAEADPSGAAVLMLLAILGWGVFTIDRRKAPRLPPR